jgi:hypothetical protein
MDLQENEEEDKGGGGGGGEAAKECSKELKVLQRESAAMVRALLRLEAVELDVRRQNEILAREALMAGYEPGILEPPLPKRRGRSSVVVVTGSNAATSASATAAATAAAGSAGAAAPTPVAGGAEG